MNEREAITFWYGCNVVRHGDIIRSAIACLEAVGYDVEAAGGPAYCCGTSKDANLRAAEGMAVRTVAKFNAAGREVVTWCPSCHRHMGSFMGEYTAPAFELSHFAALLHARRERLAPRLVHAVRRRVLVHRHFGFREVDVNPMVAELLALVPGLEVVATDYAAPGHMCSALAAVPAAFAEVRTRTSANAREAGVDDVVTVYHSCQRMLCDLAADAGFGVVNWVTILARSLGLETRDEYGEWKRAGSTARIEAQVGAARIERVGREFFTAEVLPELAARAKP